MDPQTALDVLLSSDSDADDRADAQKALTTWLRHGGFAPRVQAHPATDAWMSGDRFGVVVKVGHKYLHVRMNASGRTRRFLPENLVRVPDYLSTGTEAGV